MVVVSVNQHVGEQLNRKGLSEPLHFNYLSVFPVRRNFKETNIKLLPFCFSLHAATLSNSSDFTQMYQTLLSFCWLHCARRSTAVCDPEMTWQRRPDPEWGVSCSLRSLHEISQLLLFLPVHPATPPHRRPAKNTRRGRVLRKDPTAGLDYRRCGSKRNTRVRESVRTW